MYLYIGANVQLFMSNLVVGCYRAIKKYRC